MYIMGGKAKMHVRVVCRRAIRKTSGGRDSHIESVFSGKSVFLTHVYSAIAAPAGVRYKLDFPNSFLYGAEIRFCRDGSET